MSSLLFVQKDHPRIRGEHHDAHVPERPPLGSSPHTRGALGHDHARPDALGIIPACAGSTPATSRVSRASRDHPRMRGEQAASALSFAAAAGSSPHARGAPGCARPGHAREGIIPACAGSTGGDTVATVQTRDHPRMRGEHSLIKPPMYSAQGSSPHARGARALRAPQAALQGIIPACAGSTFRLRSPTWSARDHPRMRGEHAYRRREELTAQGSSPHARGAPRS